MPPRSRPLPPGKKPNPIKDIRNRKPITGLPTVHEQRAVTSAIKAGSRPPRGTCNNPDCKSSNVIEGICHSCGLVLDDSNIVSEITFGESSSGAAVVQGSFIGADQGSARSMGPAFRRAGGSEDRESTIREGRRIIEGLGQQLVVPEFTRTVGLQIFKLAAMNNFIQGRRMDMVAAVCLYSACRKADRCRVMLIDFADKIQINVFKLGRTFKALHRAITIAKDGIMPVLPEDLIWRFASLLDFDTLTNKVADDAIRMAQRMSLDWMLMGRRPSGVCGACLILAARMNNFRRTVTEVVYVVKVTTNTIQKRLEEFKLTPTSALTVDEFVNNEFLESAHDPPSFYQKTEEFQNNKKRRKRKRVADEDEEGEEDEFSESQNTNDGRSVSNKNQRAIESGSVPASDEAVTEDPIPMIEIRRDADGFAIPAQPVRSHEIPIDPALIDDSIAEQSRTTFEELVKEFGDAGTLPEEEVDVVEDGDVDTDDGEDAAEPVESLPRKRGRPKESSRAVHVPAAWAATEIAMEQEITEMINDPNTIIHATNYAKARQRAAAHVLAEEKSNPQKEINMDVHVGEDEFKDDPEVQNCLLSPADVAKKERVWINANKDWLRRQQLKEWNKKQAANLPPKARRNRKKKPRMGEGQTSAASSPAEAAISVLKQRSFSKKINYNALGDLFADIADMSKEKGLGSSATSRFTSRAGSEMLDSELSTSRASSMVPSVIESERTTPAPSVSSGLLLPVKKAVSRAQKRIDKAEAAVKVQATTVAAQLTEEEEGDDDDHFDPNAAPIVPTAPVEEVDDDDEQQADELDDYNDWEPEPDPFIDDDEGARGFGSDQGNEDFEDFENE